MNRILYVQYTNPAGYPPLEHSSRILAERGWEVLFLGTGAEGAADRFEFPPHPRIRVRRRRFIQPGWRQKIHFVWFHLWVLCWILLWRPRWVYASDLMACLIGWLSTFIPGIGVLYHEHDSPSQQSAASGQRSVARPESAVVRSLLWCRRRLACRADLCVMPNQARIDLFRQSTGRTAPIECVWNCPSKEEIKVTNESPRNRNLLRLYYHGNLGPNLMPPALIEAMKQLSSKVELKVVGYRTVGERHDDALRELARKRGLGDAVRVESPVPRYELFDKMLACDVGIALMPPEAGDVNFQHMVGASNKVFDYLANGLALLVSDLPEWRRTFVEPRYGLACDPGNADSIAAALRWFLDHPEETRQMGERGRQRILQEWNYEAQFARVLAVLSSKN